jgi:hypothetical protein
MMLMMLMTMITVWQQKCGCSWNWRCPGSEREIVTGNGGFAGRSVHRWLKPVTLNFL